MIVWGKDPFLMQWVGKALKRRDFGPCVTATLTHDGNLAGGIVFGNLQVSPDGEPISMEFSAYVVDNHCLSRYAYRELFAYPFGHLRVKRLQATVAKKHKTARNLLERLGFRLEGIAREAWQTGGDSALYAMLASEYRNGIFKPLGSNSARPSGNLGSTNQIQSGNGPLSIRA